MAISDLFVHAHHPDRLRRPAPRPGRAADDAVCAALTWNVFRTLALVPPAFWTRRLRARLGAIDADDHTPSVAEVRLWEPLGTAWTGAVARADALVETDGALYAVMALYRADLPLDAVVTTRADALLTLIDAASRQAGVKDCYVVVVTSAPGDAPVAESLLARYRPGSNTLAQRLADRRDGLANLRAVGRVTWDDLAAILRDCAASPALDTVERALAQRAVEWLAQIDTGAPCRSFRGERGISR